MDLPTLDTPTITHLVRRLLPTGDLHLVDWHISPLTVIPGQNTGGIYRASGTAEHNGALTNWSLILKVVAAPPPNAPPLFTEPDQSLYWKREIVAYQSGVLNNLPGGLRAPRLLDATQESDGSYHIYLEDLADSNGPIWPLTQYARAAHILGAFNGAYLTGTPIPSYPWLVPNGATSQRRAIERSTWLRDLVADPATWQHPLLRSTFSASLPGRLLNLWDARDTLFNAFARLPLTLCHLDAWQANLFFPPTPSPDTRLIAIDWAFIGKAPPGIDIGDLLSSFVLFRVEPTDPHTLDSTIFHNYLNGLHESGWQGDPRHIRFAYTAFTALKYALRTHWLADAVDETKHRTWEIHSRHSMLEFLQCQSVFLPYLLDMADEALLLMPHL